MQRPAMKFDPTPLYSREPYYRIPLLLNNADPLMSRIEHNYDFYDFSLSYKFYKNCDFFRILVIFAIFVKFAFLVEPFSSSSANIHFVTNLTKNAISRNFVKFAVLVEPFNKFQLANMTNITRISLVLLTCCLR